MLLTGSRQEQRRVRSGYLGWEGDQGRRHDAVLADGGAYPLLCGLFVWYEVAEMTTGCSVGCSENIKNAF